MKQFNKHTTTLLLTSLISIPTQAAVNMKDASFIKTINDFKDFERTYNSRSLHDGIFGFGWCSAFEKKLEIAVNGQVTLKDCTQNTDTIYKNSVSSEGELLKFNDSKYIISNSNKKMIFNKNGELINLNTADGKKFNLTYDQSGFLRKISNKKSILRLNYEYSNRKVKEIISSGLTIQYQYQEQNLLQSIHNNNEIYKYKYDKLHNLLEIQYPDLSKENLTYDVETDRVNTFKNRKDCIDSFKYSQKENSMISTLEKSCSQRLISRVQFEFLEKIRNDGRSYIDKLTVTDGPLVKEITYDAFSGATKKVIQKNALRMAASKGSYE